MDGYGTASCAEIRAGVAARLRDVSLGERAAAQGFQVAEREADNVPGPSSKLGHAQSWTNRVVGAIGGVILASGVVGTVISFYLQGRSWEYQTRSAKIEKDSAAVLAALEGVDKLLDEKWLSTYELNDAIKTKLEGEKLDAATRRFYSANKDWELRHNILASNLKIAVDSQFGIDDRNMDVSAVDCRSYTLKGLQPHGADPLPVGALLEIAYNCHNTIKGKIDDQLRAKEQNNSVWPATNAEPDPGGLALSHIWWVDRVLQCMMVERALELRQQSPQVPILPLGASEESHPYTTNERERAREEQCVEPYKKDPVLGRESLKSH
jgi:hypothetical protein